MNEENGFVLKPEMYSQNEWYEMFLSILKEFKKIQQENVRLKDKIEKAIKFVDEYMDEWDFHDEVWKDLNDLLILLKEN